VAAEAAVPLAFDGLCRAVAAEKPSSTAVHSGAELAPDVPTVSWQYLLLYGQLSDFTPGHDAAASSSSSSSTKGSSHSSTYGDGELPRAGIGRCLLDVLMERDGIGSSHRKQQKDQDVAKQLTASLAQEHSQHTGDCVLTVPRPQQQQVGGLSRFQRLALIKVG